MVWFHLASNKINKTSGQKKKLIHITFISPSIVRYKLCYILNGYLKKRYQSLIQGFNLITCSNIFFVLYEVKWISKLNHSKVVDLLTCPFAFFSILQNKVHLWIKFQMIVRCYIQRETIRKLLNYIFFRNYIYQSIKQDSFIRNLVLCLNWGIHNYYSPHFNLCEWVCVFWWKW